MERKQNEYKEVEEKEEKEEREEKEEEEKQEEEDPRSVQERFQELFDAGEMTEGEEEEEDDAPVLEMELIPQQWWESDEAFMARLTAFQNGIFYEDPMEYLHSILHKKNP